MKRRLAGISITALVLTLGTQWSPPAQAARHQSVPGPWKVLAKAQAYDKNHQAAKIIGWSTIGGTVKDGKKTTTTAWRGDFTGKVTTASAGWADVSEALSSKVNGKTQHAALEYQVLNKKMVDRPVGTPKWKCASISLLNQIPVWTPVVVSVPGKIKGAAAKTTKVKIGTTTYWRVIVTQQSKTSKETDKTTNYYTLDLKTYAPIGIAWVSTTKGNGRNLTMKSSGALSNYGKTKTQKLPSCSA